MRSLCILLLSAAALASCSPRHTITAHIEGLGDSVYIGWYDITKPIVSDADATWDTIPAVDGRFVYDVATEGPVLMRMISAAQIGFNGMWPESSTINMFIRPGEKIRIEGQQFDNYLDYSVRGSAGNEQWARHTESMRPLTILYDSIRLETNKAMFQRGWQGERAESLMPVRDSLRRGIQQLKRNFIGSHPDSWVSGIYLLDAVGADSTGIYLERLSPAVREGFLKPMLDKRHADFLEYQAVTQSKKTIVQGASAPAFTLADREGKSVSLADIDAEYVVLDFWGSWCGPCISGFPRMKEYYAKYRSQVEFVGIACRDKQENWIAALDKYTPEWTQLIDDLADSTPLKYGVDAYPTKIILDSSRKIVGIFVGEGEDFYQALDGLLR